MKRKLAAVLVCLMLVSASAGCGSKKTENSSSDQSSAQSAASGESKNAADEGKTSEESKGGENAASAENSSLGSSTPVTQTSNEGEGSELPDPESDIIIDIDGDGEGDQGISIDEEGNITIDPDQFSGWEEDTGDEDGEEDVEGESDEILSQYQGLVLSPEGFGSGFDKPVAYVITSEDELAGFIKDNDATYSLTKEYEGAEGYFIPSSFKSETSDATADYFEAVDMLVVVTPYSKSNEIDLAEITTDENGTVKVIIWAQKPKDANDKGYVCFIAEVAKDSLKGKTVTAVIDPDIIRYDDLDGDIIVEDE